VSGQGAGFRYVVAGFCFLLGLVNYLDRVVISFAIGPIERDFAITDASFGMLMSAFAVGTLAVNGVSGHLLDRFGAKRVWGIGLVVWSGAMILQGVVEAFWIFLALRVLMGLGEGVNFPAMNRALVDWMKPGELGRALSFALLGVPLALLVGGLALAPLIDGMGWRWSFVALGVVGLVLAGLFFAIYRQPAVERGVKPGGGGEGVPLGTLLRNPTLLATGWSFFAFGWVLFFGLSWLPGYLEQDWGMDLKTVGWSSTLPWAIALVLMPVGGWLSDAIMARTGRTRTARVHLIWVCQLLAVLFFLPVPMVGSAGWAVVCISLAIGFSMAPNSPYYSICADLFPSRAGVATGVIVTFFSASGVVCPWVTGWIADVAGGFGPAFATLCVVVGSGVAGMLLFARGGAAPVGQRKTRNELK
jgi:MFS transporter, ACS family, hexuronate transporter